jgi:hypothetical protein
MKRGQVTLFVVLGIVIVAVVGLAIYYSDSISDAIRAAEVQETSAVSQEAKAVQSFVKGCLKKTAENSLLTVGSKGGKNVVSSGFTKDGFNTNYLFKDGVKSFYKKDDMGVEFSRYVDSNIAKCTLGFKGYKGVTASSPKTSVKISEDSVTFTTKWAVSVKGGSAEETLKVFKERLEVNVNGIYSITSSILDSLSSKSLCVSCISKDGAKEDIDATIDVYDKDMVFTLDDTESDLNGTSLKFIFAVRQELKSE